MCRISRSLFGSKEIEMQNLLFCRIYPVFIVLSFEHGSVNGRKLLRQISLSCHFSEVRHIVSDLHGFQFLLVRKFYHISPRPFAQSMYGGDRRMSRRCPCAVRKELFWGPIAISNRAVDFLPLGAPVACLQPRLALDHLLGHRNSISLITLPRQVSQLFSFSNIVEINAI